jgi:transposase-like protein
LYWPWIQYGWLYAIKDEVMTNLKQPHNQKTQCPYCHLEQVKRDGNTIKGAQRFFCYNCHRYWQDGYIRSSRAFEEQKELFAWAQMHPVLMNHLLAIANNFNRHTAAKQKTILKSQACDVLLAYPRRASHGLWIKLKKQQAAKLATTESEQPWMRALQSVGYEVKVAYGWKQAVKEIEDYLGE